MCDSIYVYIVHRKGVINMTVSMNEIALFQYNVTQHWNITVDIVVYMQKLTAAT